MIQKSFDPVSRQPTTDLSRCLVYFLPALQPLSLPHKPVGGFVTEPIVSVKNPVQLCAATNLIILSPLPNLEMHR